MGQVFQLLPPASVYIRIPAQGPAIIIYPAVTYLWHVPISPLGACVAWCIRRPKSSHKCWASGRHLEKAERFGGRDLYKQRL